MRKEHKFSTQFRVEEALLGTRHFASATHAVEPMSMAKQWKKRAVADCSAS
jgi:hypothetical protein